MALKLQQRKVNGGICKDTYIWRLSALTKLPSLGTRAEFTIFSESPSPPCNSFEVKDFFSYRVSGLTYSFQVRNDQNFWRKQSFIQNITITYLAHPQPLAPTRLREAPSSKYHRTAGQMYTKVLFSLFTLKEVFREPCSMTE